MEHPENNEEYKGLTVNSGVEQPAIINPYLTETAFGSVSCRQQRWSRESSKAT